MKKLFYGAIFYYCVCEKYFLVLVFGIFHTFKKFICLIRFAYLKWKIYIHLQIKWGINLVLIFSCCRSRRVKGNFKLKLKIGFHLACEYIIKGELFLRRSMHMGRLMLGIYVIRRKSITIMAEFSFEEWEEKA